MKKIYFLLLMVLTVSFTNAQVAGIYESYAVLNIRNTGNVYYDLEANTSNPDFNGVNLGDFTSNEVLAFAGGEMKTFKNSGADVTGGNIYYRVYSGSTGGSFSSIGFNFLEDLGGGNQKWGSLSGTENILAGLSHGNYTLEVYVAASTSDGIKYSSNGGANFKATFKVVQTLGVNNINSPNFKTFVDGGKLYTAKKGNLNIQILDYSGRVVKSINTPSSTAGVDLNLPKKGNYLIKVNNEVIKIAY